MIVNDEATQEGYSFSVPYPADARLIAAAPRMLEALKSLRSLSAFKAEANGAGTVYCWCDHEQPDDPNADHAPLCITFRALLREIHGGQ